MRVILSCSMTYMTVSVVGSIASVNVCVESDLASAKQVLRQMLTI